MKNKLLKQVSKISFFTATILFCAYFFVPGVAEALGTLTSGFRVDSGDYVDIYDVHGDPCKRVVVSGSDPKDYFVPTKTDPEWQSFKANKPGTVGVVNCPTDPNAACTDTFTYGGKEYWGEWMGGNYDYLPDSQCWLVQNIDVGTLSGTLTDNGISEKFCYNGTVNASGFCNTGPGALYTQSEAKQYSTATSTGTVIGLCPPGWRVPNVADFERLLEIVGCSGYTTSTCVRNALLGLFPYTGRANWTGTTPPYTYTNLTDEGKYLTTEFGCNPTCQPIIFNLFAQFYNYNPISSGSGSAVALKCIKEWGDGQSTGGGTGVMD